MLSLSGPSSLPKTGIRELNPQQIAGYLLAALIIPSRDDPDDKRAHKVHCVATREATEASAKDFVPPEGSFAGLSFRARGTGDVVAPARPRHESYGSGLPLAREPIGARLGTPGGMVDGFLSIVAF
jgi:hypothetical protein